jgi:hypothetical protein
VPAEPTSGAPAAVTSGTPAEPTSGAAPPNSGTAASLGSGDPSPPSPPERPLRANIPALREVGIDRQKVIRATAHGDLVALLRAFGCPTGRDLMVEWDRDVDGLRLAMVAVILGWRRHYHAPVRLPSGFRAAREAWRRLHAAERYAIAADMADLYGLPPPTPLAPPEPPEPPAPPCGSNPDVPPSAPLADTG